MAKYRIVSKGNIVTIKSKLSLGNRLMSGKSIFLNNRFSAAVSDRDRKEKDDYLHSTRCGTSYIISEKGCGGRNVFSACGADN